MNHGNDSLVLVTGGSGFVAGWCIVELLRRGHVVRATLRDPARAPAVRAAIASAGVATDALGFVTADLTVDADWDAAVAGCDHVLHVASPLGDVAADPRADLTAPARDGTLRVLRAACAAGVRRVVMTSAAAAARVPLGSTAVSDETVWPDPADPRFDAYRRSKILAERAAWDHMAAHGGRTQLTTILPGAVFGPALSTAQLGSLQVLRRLLDGKPGALPRLGFWVVDVRDLAELHVRAMTEPAAAGERFLATGEFQWFSDLAATLRSRLGADAARVPTRVLPDFAVRVLARFKPELRMLTSELGRTNPVTADKARRVLGFAPRPVATTLVDAARSLLAPRAEAA